MITREVKWEAQNIREIKIAIAIMHLHHCSSYCKKKKIHINTTDVAAISGHDTIMK